MFYECPTATLAAHCLLDNSIIIDKALGLLKRTECPMLLTSRPHDFLPPHPAFFKPSAVHALQLLSIV